MYSGMAKATTWAEATSNSEKMPWPLSSYTSLKALGS